VFCVDEIVVFSDGDVKNKDKYSKPDPATEYTGSSDPDHFLIHLLSYLETPPHLRRALFPMHPNLRTAGTLPSLDLPHHLRSEEWCPYREGVTSVESADIGTTLVDAGLKVPVTVDAEIPPLTRVTIQFDKDAEAAAASAKPREIRGEAVNPAQPREEGGYYWGYTVRRADSLSTVFTECGFDGGYDITIGTSERGIHLDELYEPKDGTEDGETNVIGKFKHLLLVFGGVAGLEVALKNDTELQKLGVKEAKDVFDRWVNVCPGQGSRTIRTEEAVWIGLMGLRRIVEKN
jgi:predicted SPOUT superfamily RNA methylase MTH1